MHSSGFFQIKLIARLILKCKISRSHTISDQSLLLSTIVLNDMYVHMQCVCVCVHVHVCAMYVNDDMLKVCNNNRLLF